MLGFGFLVVQFGLLCCVAEMRSVRLCWVGFSCFVCSFDWLAGVGCLLIDGFVNGGGWA